MATRTVLVDDLDDSTDDVQTVPFSAFGVDYEADYGPDSRQALEEALAPFINSARRVGGRRRRGNSAVTASADTSVTNAELRDWARSQGLDVSERGRVSAAIREAYEAAH